MGDLIITKDGKIFYDGMDITWNDRMIAQVIRAWIKDYREEYKEEDNARSDI